MKEHGASEAEIDQFRRTEIIVKSVKLIKEQASAMEVRRKSPERFRNADPKVKTINPYAKLLSSSP
jgi:hypothetical protein